MCEHVLGKVNARTVESLSLGLVHGHCEADTHGKLSPTPVEWELSIFRLQSNTWNEDNVVTMYASNDFRLKYTSSLDDMNNYEPCAIAQPTVWVCWLGDPCLVYI